MKLYRITRLFTSGTLAGLTHTEVTTVHFDVGFECAAWAYCPSGYRIIAVEEVTEA